MPIRVLSWNMHFGNLNNNILPFQAGPPPIARIGPPTSPAERFNYIGALAASHNVDIVFLQEHPGAGSQHVGDDGLLVGSAVPAGYTYQVFPEMDAAIGNRVSLSNRAYAILFQDQTCHVANPQYFHQEAFLNNPQLQSHMRCPVLYLVEHGNINYTFFNWHNEVGNFAAHGVHLFTALQPPIGTVLVGDLNQTAHQINGFPFFNHWNDIVVNNPPVGVDHIMTQLNCHPVLGQLLQFTSDAHHFPIAADIAANI